MPTAESPRSFLTAQWRHLAMLNYEIPPALLARRIPAGTELDFFNGRTFVSMVGFMFLQTRVKGIPVPLHRNFEEVNLRFYVRRRGPEGWRRGVCFVKEIVPRFAIAWLARMLYNEPYVALPMEHRIEDRQQSLSVEYAWHFAGKRHSLSVVTQGPSMEMMEGSEEEFIAEHYWGYTPQRDESTIEYRVQHPRWRVWQVVESKFQCDVAALYGAEFCEALSRKPTSAFLTEGSEVSVSRGRSIDGAESQ